MYDYTDLEQMYWMPPEVVLNMLESSDHWVDREDIERGGEDVVVTEVHLWNATIPTSVMLNVSRKHSRDILLNIETHIVADRMFLRCGRHREEWVSKLKIGRSE